jgi:integrase
LTLTWDAVDFRKRLITVRAAYAENGDSRSVPMNAVVKTLLEGLRKAGTPGEAVFLNRWGWPYWNYQNAFTQAARRAGGQDVTFHDLRHTFASRLIMAGVDLATAQELLGHRKIEMTCRYVHPSDGHKQRTVSALESCQEMFAQNSPQLATRKNSKVLYGRKISAI